MLQVWIKHAKILYHFWETNTFQPSRYGDIFKTMDGPCKVPKHEVRGPFIYIWKMTTCKLHAGPLIDMCSKIAFIKYIFTRFYNPNLKPPNSALEWWFSSTGKDIFSLPLRYVCATWGFRDIEENCRFFQQPTLPSFGATLFPCSEGEKMSWFSSIVRVSISYGGGGRNACKNGNSQSG